MIIEPSVAKLMENEHMDSRYTLVVAAAKRAREIAEVDAKIDKTVKLAVQDIADGKVRIIPSTGEDWASTENVVYKEYIEESDEDNPEEGK